MSLFSKFKETAKDATGIGLNADEQYQRAYEKGVFLRPQEYQTAVKWFLASAEQHTQNGNSAAALRAQANAAIYELLRTKDLGDAIEAVRVVSQLEEIECVGSNTEMMPAKTLADEIQVLVTEVQAMNADSATRSERLKAASDLLFSLRNATPQVLPFLCSKGPLDSFTKRAFYCLSLSEESQAAAMINEFPDKALDEYFACLAHVRQASDTELEQKLTKVIGQLQVKRHCWMCGREMVGNGIYFKFYPSRTTKYHHRMLADTQDDTAMIDSDGSVCLCSVCGSTIELQANSYAVARATEVRQWAAEIFDQHQRSIETLQSEIVGLQAEIALLHLGGRH